ncbi:MAG: lyase domain protein repeat-containing protein [Pedosphaera sp.]|nr:lyase domain protein repeat-containing protein [Pedosphaera sp.]
MRIHLHHKTDNSFQGSRSAGARVGIILVVALLAAGSFFIIRWWQQTHASSANGQIADVSGDNLTNVNTPKSWNLRGKPSEASSAPNAPAELVYQKKTLSEWLEDMESSDPEVIAIAVEAFRGMGPSAKDAIPRLADLLDPARSPSSAAQALVNIGKDSLPVLLNALTNSDVITRLEVAGAIGGLHDDADEAVPALVSCLTDEVAGIRANAIASLQLAPKHPDIAVPALITCLADDDLSVRSNAVTVIRKFGKDAESAVPELIRLATDDDNPDLQATALESLKEIAPERVKAEGL